MKNVLEVKKTQLKEKVGCVCAWDTQQGEDPEYPNVFVAYVNGDIPVMMKSTLTKEEFDKLCE